MGNILIFCKELGYRIVRVGNMSLKLTRVDPGAEASALFISRPLNRWCKATYITCDVLPYSHWSRTVYRSTNSQQHLTNGRITEHCSLTRSIRQNAHVTRCTYTCMCAYMHVNAHTRISSLGRENGMVYFSLSVFPNFPKWKVLL